MTYDEQALWLTILASALRALRDAAVVPHTNYQAMVERCLRLEAALIDVQWEADNWRALALVRRQS